jgi:MoxR-like ATPase
MNLTTSIFNRTRVGVLPTNGNGGAVHRNGYSLDSLRELNAQVETEAAFLHELLAEVNKVMVGQDALVTQVLIALLADGHVLLEGVPGLAKTLLVKTMAQAIDARFSRLQFTPDLLPADLVGTQIYNAATGAFSVHRGPLFANLILADEINRAPAKVQSALLEAMQERQITIGDTTHKMDDLFLVLATQNPIEQEGTYPLPEAQVDRFMLKVLVDYPRRDEERLMLDRMTGAALPTVRPILTPERLLRARTTIRNIYVDERIKEYVLDLVRTTRTPAEFGLNDLKPLITMGASPRAGISMIVAARALAFIQGRGFVTPEDIKQIAPDVLRHRVTISYEAEAENITSDAIVRRILDTTEVP